MNIIKHPLSTEKSLRLLEAENKMVFIVDIKANKQRIKEDLEKTFNIKVSKINTLITPGGIKKAYVKFSDETPAIDLATKLGMM